MMDIYIAMLAMTVISCLLFGLSLLLYKHLTGSWRKGIAVGIIAVILIHIFVLSNSIRWTDWLGVKAVIIYSNLLIPLNGLLSGFVWGNRTLSGLRRTTAIGLLMFLAYLPTIYQIYPIHVPYHDIWEDNICIQSSYTSCVPAAGATLLNYYGIDSSEEEMARLCLTRYEGTPLLGLYRGMRMKAEGSIYDVVIGRATIKQLQNDIGLPAIVIISLDEETNKRKPFYSENDGFIVGVSHSVVLFGFTDDGRIEVGDPSVGREIWSLETLEDLWDGDYIRLE